MVPLIAPYGATHGEFCLYRPAPAALGEVARPRARWYKAWREPLRAGGGSRFFRLLAVLRAGYFFADHVMHPVGGEEPHPAGTRGDAQRAVLLQVVRDLLQHAFRLFL